MSWIERRLRAALVRLGVASRHVDTVVARHHVYDAPGRGALPAVVLLPGLCDSAASHIPLLLFLRARCRRVVVIESAGHGLSGTSLGPYTAERHLESVTAVLDQVLGEPAILVGNSLGGATALHYAHARPHRVLALYLTSPAGAPVAADATAAIREAFAMRTRAEARAFIGLVFHRPPVLLAGALARLLRARAAATEVHELLRTMESKHATPPELAALTMPTTLVWGRSERLLPPSALAYFRTHLPAHAAVLEPGGMGHCPHLDDPARLARMILKVAATV